MIRAALILVLGMSLIPLGDTAGKLLVDQHGIPPIFVAWSRFALGALLLLPFMARAHLSLGSLLDWRLWFRGALIAAGVISILTALRTEPLPNVYGAFFSGPIVSYLLSVSLLGERVTSARTALLCLGFVGVLLIVRPGFGMNPGLAFAMLAGLFYGAYLAASRWLAGAAPPRSLLFVQLVGGASLMTPWGVAEFPSLVAPIAWLVLLSAAASAAGNLLLVLAYGRAPATHLAPFIYFQLVAATAYGWAVFGTLPDAISLLGLLLLLISGLGSLHLRR